MSFFTRKRRITSDGPGIIGPVRLARSVDDLSAVRAGDVVLIQVEDLEPDTAAVLVERQVAAVLNVSRSSSGRYPNLGPQTLLDGGILLVDEVGEGLWSTLRNGDRIRVDGATIHVGDDVVATGVEMTAERVRDAMDAASSGLATQLDSVVANASDQLRRERTLLLEGAKVPDLADLIDGRAVVVVVDGFDAESDLALIGHFLRDHDPVLIGVGAGADLLMVKGYRPRIVIGRADEISSAAIGKSDEVVVVSAAGRLDQPERFEKGGRQPLLFNSGGNSEDLALLLADTNGADLIVQVGAPPRLVDHLDRATTDIAGAFIARLRAGAKVVDAKAVKYFERQRIGWFAPTLLLLAGIVAVFAALAVTPVGQDWLAPVLDPLRSAVTWIEGLFS